LFYAGSRMVYSPRMLRIRMYKRTLGLRTLAPIAGKYLQERDSPKKGKVSHDRLGRLIGQNVLENASSAGPQLTCSGLSGKWTNCYLYDANGNQTSSTDNRNITITNTYDALNRILRSQPSDTTWVSAYGYDRKDACGNGLRVSGSSRTSGSA